MPDEEKTKITKDDVGEFNPDDFKLPADGKVPAGPVENEDIDEDQLAENAAIDAAEEDAGMGGVMGSPPEQPELPTDEAGEPQPYPLDRKYTLVVLEGEASIKKMDSDELVHDWVIFRAHDAAMIPMLRQYFKICSRLGSPEEHLEGVKQLINRVQAYQDEHHDEVKAPD